METTKTPERSGWRDSKLLPKMEEYGLLTGSGEGMTCVEYDHAVPKAIIKFDTKNYTTKDYYLEAVGKLADDVNIPAFHFVDTGDYKFRVAALNKRAASYMMGVQRGLATEEGLIRLLYAVRNRNAQGKKAFETLKEEGVLGSRDNISEERRLYGRDVPGVDMDYPVLNKDKEVVALIEYKHEKARAVNLRDTNYRALSDLCNKGKIPFFIVRYKGDYSRYFVTPVNDRAKKMMDDKEQVGMDEPTYKEFLNLVAEQAVLDRKFMNVLAKGKEIKGGRI